MSSHQQLLALCNQYHAVLLAEDEQRLRIAVAPNPPAQLFESLRFICDKHVEVEFWSAERLEKARHLPPSTGTEEVHEGGASVVTLLNETLQKAIQLRASDIHFEPTKESYRIRLRIDGVLQLQPLLPASLAAPLTARLKVLGNLDIAERRLPQDGQMDVDAGSGKASFRISTLPVRYGEKVVLRLLQQTEHPLELSALGMSAKDSALFQAALVHPQGMILVTGPTGSGKTLTLYSALNALNKTGTNVCSVEDPVEIPLMGLNQTQVNIKAGLTFQNILRALLRQDPDVVMVGEIRDSETAEIAIKAAQTGHLVLSTLHTNSTVETVIRLEQMGIARWLLASAIQVVIAQRLVRKLCSHCKALKAGEITLPPQLWSNPLPDWQPVGCERCYGGFYGRTALFEILPVENTLRTAIARGAHAADIEALAREQGLVTLFESGCQAVSQGLTTLEEVYRVLGVPHG
ncbi:type II secretion system protein GspE [Enterobacteriaceae bacterium H20N1]|uniref:Type II secretion system protein GspE n=1 Tax=Dryocola boscaweniae TaxID=2925397 RepID=A0A9X3AM88_9ENTR|nr:type II secretion system protein GspE [Dryocola boscaweniae]MCT4700957.1 type II secretion system protein GspE [Dryocola boscaweniae]MCT4718174.1 type II secretion system protein GspE [Dryocola boscaweniae]